ncbi:MAG: hypothetical protein EA365_08770 [Gloeocapsa sp. DLM2.Bin57]|nr:MAG: hypothetical protein EA365_08770 [Gloeocapsa sp. DLM2.Bin57]
MLQINNFPVQQLSSRYGIGRSQVYSRLNQLGITPHSINRKSYLTIAELERLDDLDDYLKKGGTIQEFINKSGVDDKSDDSTQMIVNNDLQQLTVLPSGQLVLPLDGITTLIKETVRAILPHFPSGVDDFRILQEIADNDWIIPTSRLAAIINLAPSTLQGKNEYHYCGFKFTRSGKQGSSFLWRVEKINLCNL